MTSHMAQGFGSAPFFAWSAGAASMRIEYIKIKNGKPIMEADKGHLHHRLLRSGMGQRRTVICMYGVCGIMSTAAVLLSRGLKVETTGLLGIAILYIYVVLTDPNKKAPEIKKKKKKD